MTLTPGKVRAGSYKADTGTAGYEIMSYIVYDNCSVIVICLQENRNIIFRLTFDSLQENIIRIKY